MPLVLDWNSPAFQRDLLTLEKDEAMQVLRTLKKMVQMEWTQIYQDKGLRWEYIAQKELFSFRASLKIRVMAQREGERLRLFSIHPDHDSAYE